MTKVVYECPPGAFRDEEVIDGMAEFMVGENSRTTWYDAITGLPVVLPDEDCEPNAVSDNARWTDPLNIVLVKRASASETPIAPTSKEAPAPKE